MFKDGVWAGLMSFNRVHSYNISITFRTLQDTGILFFASRIDNDPFPLVRYDFFSISIENGVLVHRADNGYGPGSAGTTGVYNDGLWHTVHFSKLAELLSVCVDSDCGSGSAKSYIHGGGYADIIGNYYIGGVPVGNSTLHAIDYLVS